MAMRAMQETDPGAGFEGPDDRRWNVLPPSAGQPVNCSCGKTRINPIPLVNPSISAQALQFHLLQRLDHLNLHLSYTKPVPAQACHSFFFSCELSLQAVAIAAFSCRPDSSTLGFARCQETQKPDKARHGPLSATPPPSLLSSPPPRFDNGDTTRSRARLGSHHGRSPRTQGLQGVQPRLHCRREIHCDQGAGTRCLWHCLVSLPEAGWRCCLSHANPGIPFLSSAAVNNQTSEGVAIKKVTNVFSKKILAKRALREIKLLQHFRGHRNVGQPGPSRHVDLVRQRADMKLSTLDYMSV